MTTGLSNVATNKRELVGKAKRAPSTAVSRGIGRVPGNSSQIGQENDIASNFDVLFEGGTMHLKEESRYRMFIDLERIAAETPTAIWHSKGGPREVTIWCSNDLLGKRQNPALVQAMVDIAFRLGTGSGGTSDIGRANHPLVELARELAGLHLKEEAPVFTSGYVANQSSISTIAKLSLNSLILSDELNHNLMIEGVNQSNRAKQIFLRNDRAHHEHLPQRQPDGARNADRLCNPDRADLGCRNLQEGAP